MVKVIIWWAAALLFAIGSYKAKAETIVSIDVGVNINHIQIDPNHIVEEMGGPNSVGYHLSAGVHKSLSDNHFLGMRFDADDIQGYRLLSIRALDYQYQLSQNFKVGAFFGGSEYDYRQPAYGWYLGGGIEWDLPAIDNLSLLTEVRLGVTLNRSVLEGEVAPRPDIHIDMTGAAVSLRYSF